MPRDAQGPDSPLGDNAEFQDLSAAEDFLGLGAASAETEPEVHGGPGLDQPSPEELQAAGAPQAAELQNADPIGSPELRLAVEPDPLAEFTSGETESELEEDFEEDSASWLMEFDLSDAEDESEGAFADALQDSAEFDAETEQAGSSARTPWLGRALIAVVSVAAGVVGAKFMSSPANPGGAPAGEDVAQVENVPESASPDANTTAPTTSSPNTGPASAEAPSGGTQPVAESTAVAQTNMPSADPAGSQRASRSDPAASNKPRAIALVRGGRWQAIHKGSPSTNPAETVEVAVAEGPAPAAADTQPPISAEPDGSSAGDPAVVVDMQGPGAGRERRTQNMPIEDMVMLPAETEGGLRQASSAELSNIWPNSSIPLEAIDGSTRLLTPAVGRVRVVLASGEVFEGKLYAVGSRKVWIETKLGKLALLDYQIDRVEHIVGADGDSLTGSDGNADLAGLQGVRVRTAGGVFYGKLLSRDGATVTIVTDSGGRLTLQDAHVESAGKTATQLVDSSGAKPKTDSNE